MRKLLTPKYGDNVNFLDTLGPRKKVDTTWTRRNNSDNITTVLHPDDYLPTKKVKKQKKTEKPTVKNLECCSKRLCYCKQKKIKPKLFKKFKGKTFSDTSSCDCDLYRKKSLLCNSLIKNYDERKSYREHRKEYEAKKISAQAKAAQSPGFTKQRQSYEEYRKQKEIDKCPCYYHNEAEELYRQYFSIEKGNVRGISSTDQTGLKNHDSLKTLYKREDRKSSNTSGDSTDKKTLKEKLLDADEVYKNVDQVLSSSVGATFNSISQEGVETATTTNEEEQELDQTSSQGGDVSEGITSEEKLKEIKDFRDKHFFETHGVESTSQKIPEHKCVYRFSLDDRYAPLPTNPDGFGLNRCIICQKPMKTWTKAENKPKEKVFAGPLESLMKYYSCKLSPKEINIGTDANFELQLTGKDIQLFNDCFKMKMQKPVYNNSLALRQQKMYGSILPID